ncbi:MAG: hypothetical protein AB7P52_11505 [Alphaproteobacteria bacterium]
MRDLKSNLQAVTSLAPAAITASANGSGVDLRGFDAAMVTFVVGTVTDGTHTPSLEESDNDSSYTPVAAADLIGAFVALTSGANQSVGYRGGKRYVRAVTTVAGATTGGVYAAIVLRGRPAHAPVA